MVKLSNGSALGIYRFTWIHDGMRAGITWGAGVGPPMADLNGRSMPVADSGRFGWPATIPASHSRHLAMVRQFAQAYADALAAAEDDPQ
jgi:hypothetical protein